MSAQQTIYERIKEDLKGDKILQNVILERLWYYLEPIKDITGSGGASITNGDAIPTGGADGDYYIQTTIANQIWYNNLGTWVIILSTIPITVDQADAGTMLFGVPFPIIDGQEYIITNLGITGIDHIRTVGVNLGGLTFKNNCEAYVTDLGVYVPCTYDVATNKIQIQLTNKMFVSTDGLGGITIDSVVYNEWNGITFSATNTSGGLYTFTPSQTLQTIFTAVSMHCEQVIPQGTDMVGFASTLEDYVHDEYFYTTYNTTFSNDNSIAFPHNLITFIGYIYN